MAFEDDAHIKLYRAEIARLDELHAHLDLLWSQVPRYFLVGLASPFVLYFYGLGWFVASVLVTLSLVGCQSYLVRMRKSENRWSRAQLIEDIKRREAELRSGVPIKLSK